MFLGKLYRKKRKLLLCSLRTASKALTLSMSWSRPIHNVAALERNWYQGVIHTHAACCGCGNPGAHFAALVERYNSGTMQHQRLLPPASPIRSPNNIRRARALPAAPEQPPALPWHGGGGEGDAARGGEGDAGGDEPVYEPGDLDALYAAVEEE